MALLSLEEWDDVWRRNQHLTAELVRSGAVTQVDFFEPPLLRGTSRSDRSPLPGVRAVPLALRLPKRVGGLAELGRRLRHGALATADVLWVNDPALGVHCLRRGQPVVYDVTDDWRSYDFPDRIIRRIVRAEDVLALRATTVVCSAELRRRWMERYGVDAQVIHNGVDGRAWQAAAPHGFEGPGPHVGYVGTQQPERLDVDLLLRVAHDESVGRLHLIGPDALDGESRARLSAHPKVRSHGPIPSGEVPSWTLGLDVLLSPHRVSPFTLSLDAIKSYEYLAAGRPIVATPTSGFQLLAGRPGVHVAEPEHFVPAVRAALAGERPLPVLGELDWESRARDFACLLSSIPADIN
ncbi:glycosyltransferase [Blastococcus sp. TF02-8]|uniref:glycosyltransferase n=1 Tax=Blastococcus sp. TF02-8 TaxID=2250574 RepID=UPI001412180C|nr:glycosyltransferase [Blastococcus sp. TF02-8]